MFSYLQSHPDTYMPDTNTPVSVGQPARLDATFAAPCFSNTDEEPADTIENHSEAPDIALRLLDADGQHAVPCTNANRCIYSLASQSLAQHSMAPL